MRRIRQKKKSGCFSCGVKVIANSVVLGECSLLFFVGETFIFIGISF